MPFHVTVLVHPSASHVNEVLDMMLSFGEQVRAHEPGCLSYRPFKGTMSGTNAPIIVIHEEYVDEAAFKAHADTDHYRAMASSAKARPEIGAKPLEYIVAEPCGGFAR